MTENDFWLFQGKDKRLQEHSVLPLFKRNHHWDDPENYIADDGLKHAVNVALSLGRPLLITGEAGTGKTQLAYRMAYELTPETPEPLRFQVKARSEATDLFYRYDALRHFQEVNVNQNRQAKTHDFIRMEALGIAILRAAENRHAANALLPENWRTDTPVRSVALVDEIDKAPRDLPNDLLAEIENMMFEIKETGERFNAEAEFRPVVLLTSNSERDLPDAFLRRCVYYHIPPPTRDRLREIVQKRVPLSSSFSPEMLENALTRYHEVRKIVSKKKPSTDELLAWVQVLSRLNIDPKNPNPADKVTLAFTYSILVKDAGDLQALQKEI
jgi:MoxR-like ATPase